MMICCTGVRGEGSGRCRSGVAHRLPGAHLETQRLEDVTDLVGRHEVAHRSILGPHHGEMQGLQLARHRLLETQHAPGPKDTVEAGVEPALVGDVHAAVLRPHDVEAAIVERQVECIAHEMRHSIGKPHSPGQFSRYFDVRRREVERSDQASVVRRQGARRSAEPAADIEHPSPSVGSTRLGQPGKFGEANRDRQATAMELVGCRECIDVEMIDVEPGGLQRVQHRCDEIVPIPVRRCPPAARVAHAVVLHVVATEDEHFLLQTARGPQGRGSASGFDPIVDKVNNRD